MAILARSTVKYEPSRCFTLFLDNSVVCRYTAEVGCKERPTTMSESETRMQAEPPQADEIGKNEPSALAALRHFLFEALQVMAPALVLALIVHLFLAQATIVYGQSMEPNLHPNQR